MRKILFNNRIMKKFVVTIFNFRYHSFDKVNIEFAKEELVTPENVLQKAKAKLRNELFMVISWSPVDDFLF